MHVHNKKPPGPEDETCPQWRKSMSEVCQTCRWWMEIRQHGEDGKTVATGYECAMVVAAMGTLKTAREVRQNCATTDKVKNNIHALRETFGTENLKISALLKPVFEVLTGKGFEQVAIENQQRKQIESRVDGNGSAAEDGDVGKPS